MGMVKLNPLIAKQILRIGEALGQTLRLNGAAKTKRKDVKKKATVQRQTPMLQAERRTQRPQDANHRRACLHQRQQLPRRTLRLLPKWWLRHPQHVRALLRRHHEEMT